jgi:hypothetical protein
VRPLLLFEYSKPIHVQYTQVTAYVDMVFLKSKPGRFLANKLFKSD